MRERNLRPSKSQRPNNQLNSTLIEDDRRLSETWTGEAIGFRSIP